MKRTIIIFIASFFLAGGALFGAHQAVLAAPPPSGITIYNQPQATVLRLLPVGSQQLGKNFQVTALLTTSNGTPLQDQTVNFLVGGLFQGQARTDAQGQAVLSITTDYSAGNYSLKAIFQGTRQYNPTSVTTPLVVTPFVLEVQCVPALAGVKFRIGDQIFTSGKDGVAQASVSRVGSYTLEWLPANTPDSNQRVEFNRWVDENYVPFRTVSIPTDKPLQVGLEVSYKVGQTFVDLQNRPVDLSRITSITMKSSQGTTYTFNDGQPRWLPASLVTRRVGGLDVVQVQYSVMNVQVDGSNVVSQAQQRFFAHPGETWPIQLLLFSAQFSAKDAFLGFPVGKGISLQYPDGTRQNFKFDKNNTVQVTSLARGIYLVQVQGVSGFTPTTPVALSQNQVMDMSVLTRLDIFLAVTLVALLALGLVAVGRAQVLRRRRTVRSVPYSRRVPQANSLIGSRER